MLVALQPCADRVSEKNLEKTIYKQIEVDEIPFVDEEFKSKLRNKLTKKSSVAIWGVKSDAAHKQWSKLEDESVVLFYRNKQFFLQGRILQTIQDERLAEYLWGRDDEGKTFQYLYFIDDVAEITQDVFSFNEAVGYSRSNFVQGFTVLNEERSVKALSSISSLNKFQGKYFELALLEQLQKAFIHFGGEASLKDVYSFIKSSFGFPISYADYQSMIRKTIYRHSSDADIYEGKHDLFYIVGIKSEGLWGLRDFVPDEEHVELTEDDEGFPEGKVKLRQHLSRERNPKLIREAKRKFKEKHGKLYCEACNFNFENTYGVLGADYIEGHHITPVSELSEGDVSKVEDIVMLCANCHKMVHRRRPWLGMEELTFLVQSSH